MLHTLHTHIARVRRRFSRLVLGQVTVGVDDPAARRYAGGKR